MRDSRRRHTHLITHGILYYSYQQYLTRSTHAWPGAYIVYYSDRQEGRCCTERRFALTPGGVCTHALRRGCRKDCATNVHRKIEQLCLTRLCCLLYVQYILIHAPKKNAHHNLPTSTRVSMQADVVLLYRLISSAASWTLVFHCDTCLSERANSSWFFFSFGYS